MKILTSPILECPWDLSSLIEQSDTMDTNVAEHLNPDQQKDQKANNTETLVKNTHPPTTELTPPPQKKNEFWYPSS